MEYLNPPEMPTAKELKAFFDELLDSMKHLAQNLSFVEKYLFLICAAQASLAASMLADALHNHPEMSGAGAARAIGLGLGIAAFIAIHVHLELLNLRRK